MGGHRDKCLWNLAGFGLKAAEPQTLLTERKIIRTKTIGFYPFGVWTLMKEECWPQPPDRPSWSPRPPLPVFSAVLRTQPKTSHSPPAHPAHDSHSPHTSSGFWTEDTDKRTQISLCESDGIVFELKRTSDTVRFDLPYKTVNEWLHQSKLLDYKATAFQLRSVFPPRLLQSSVRVQTHKIWCL